MMTSLSIFPPSFTCSWVHFPNAVAHFGESRYCVMLRSTSYDISLILSTEWGVSNCNQKTYKDSKRITAEAKLSIGSRLKCFNFRRTACFSGSVEQWCAKISIIAAIDLFFVSITSKMEGLYFFKYIVSIVNKTLSVHPISSAHPMRL